MTTFTGSGFRDFEEPDDGDDAPDRYPAIMRRRAMISWLVISVALAAVVIVLFVIADPASSAPGGCGGG